jgi:hypothetical protein
MTESLSTSDILQSGEIQVFGGGVKSLPLLARLLAMTDAAGRQQHHVIITCRLVEPPK